MHLRSAALCRTDFIFLYTLRGADICYNGDIDPSGLCIADRLWKKFGDRLQIWRMSPEDYENCLSKEPLEESELAKVDQIAHPVLQKTAAALKDRKKAGYQENMLKELLEDILCG